MFHPFTFPQSAHPRHTQPAVYTQAVRMPCPLLSTNTSTLLHIMAVVAQGSTRNQQGEWAARWGACNYPTVARAVSLMAS
jgi:hypothetical protein